MAHDYVKQIKKRLMGGLLGTMKRERAIKPPDSDFDPDVGKDQKIVVRLIQDCIYCDDNSIAVDNMHLANNKFSVDRLTLIYCRKCACCSTFKKKTFNTPDQILDEVLKKLKGEN